jgi:Domain of unknown function (DUF4157)
MVMKAQSPIQVQASFTSAPSLLLRRKCACGGHAAGACADCERKKQMTLRRALRPAHERAHEVETSVPPIVHEVLRTSGQPLDPTTRGLMESRFGHNFGHVRVHADAHAARSANAVDALAYTVGRDIVFGAGRYAPATSPGRQLLAHELTHVVQQRAGFARPSNLSDLSELRLGEPHDQAELQADSIAQQIEHAATRPETGVGRQDRQSENGLSTLLSRPVQTPAMPVLRRSRSGFFSTIGGFFVSLFTSESGFSEERLDKYLEGLDKTNDIEGDPDSDDMARAIVSRWMANNEAFDLTPKLKKLLILEMLDGPTTEPDEQRILDLLETSSNVDLRVIFAPGAVSPQQLQSDLDNEESKKRLEAFFNKRVKGGLAAAIKGKVELTKLDYKSMTQKEQGDFIERNFPTNREMAEKILKDLLAVKGDEVDFEDEQELKTEIFKRIRISELMKRSQTSDAFDYPESMTEEDHCAGYDKQNPMKNARVNKAARQFWTDVIVDPRYIYYFNLSPEGKENAFEALVSLFTPQRKICDKTLIHCDYLTSVIQLRTFAETIGAKAFNARIKRGEAGFSLTYYGSDYLIPPDVKPAGDVTAMAVTPKSVSLQVMRPASEADLVIGDHVVFWNHLGYDALTAARPGPWRLENAVLVDKDSQGRDLYEGHGAPYDVVAKKVKPAPKDVMLEDLIKVYNGHVTDALAMTKDVEHNNSQAQEKLNKDFPFVQRGADGKWLIRERQDRDENKRRPKQSYELRELTGPDDPELIGLRDPYDQSKMGTVERPIESRKEPLPPTAK